MEGSSSGESRAQDDTKKGQTVAPADPHPKKKYEPIQMATPEQLAQEDFMNNCVVRSVLAGGAGGAMGLLFGLVFGSMDGAGYGVEATEVQKPVRQVLRDMARTAGSRSWSYAKGFAVFGLLFAGSECVIEQYRAKHDIWNSTYAGCATGGILARSGGPVAMCAGCASFAAFSAFIDKIMDQH